MNDSSGSGVPNVQVLADSGSFQMGGVTDSSGNYAISGIPAGTYGVTATSGTTKVSVNGVVVGTGATVPVNISLTSATITVSPTVTSVDGGQDVQFTASGAGLPVSWSTSPATGTINTSGRYTAPTGTAASTVTVRATSDADSAVTAAATVFVNGKITLTIGSSSVVGGTNLSNCRITLSSPAPQGGLTINLSSSNQAVVNPVPTMSISGNQTMSIPAGAVTSSAFEMATSVVTSNTVVTLTAAAAGMTSSVDVTVKPTEILGIALGQTSVNGGDNAISNVVWLAGPAPAGGVAVTLTSSDPAVTVPASVSVTEGRTSSASFSIATSPVPAAKVVTITGKLNGTTKTADLTVLPVGTTTKLTLYPTVVRGGVVTTANTIALAAAAPTGGVTIPLKSSNPAVASVPASVVIAAGTTSGAFTITTAPVAADTDLIISAGASNLQVSQTLTVRAPIISQVYIRSSEIGGGAVAQSNRVNIDGPAPAGGLVVSLTSSSPLVTPPATVQIAEGQTVSTYFDMATFPTKTAVEVTITATLNGNSRANTITVRPPALYSLSVVSSSVAGATTVTGNKVTLDGPAPAGGAAVALTSSDPAAASVPSTVLVPAGQTVALFDVQVTGVGSNAAITITASYGGVSKTGNLTVRSTALSSMYIAQTSIVGGSTANNNRVTLDGPAPAGGAIVSLSSSHPVLAPVPATVLVPEGQTASAIFPLTTAWWPTLTTVTITATYNGVSKTDSFDLRMATLSSIAISSSSVTGGSPAKYSRVTLDGPAGPDGVIVRLSSSDPDADVPATVIVPAGATSCPNFLVNTNPVSASKAVAITATYGGISRTDTLTINP